MQSRRLVLSILAGLFAASLLALPEPATAQESSEPGVVVVSEYRCGYQYLDDLTAYHQEHAAPILDRLVEEGKLNSWGILHHQWGGEYNYVVYYTADSRDAFFAAHDEFFKELDVEKALETTGDWCDAHRDNIYSVARTSSSGG